jgi:hypothetical protein
MIIIIIIIFINCNWVVTRWQWLFNTYTKHVIGSLLNLRREGKMAAIVWNILCTTSYFQLHGTVSKQNFRYRSAENSHQLHRPLYYPKVTLLCAVWSREIIGPYFFEDKDGHAITVISQHYTKTMNEFLAPKLPLNYNLWFQQDGASTHAAWRARLLFAICFRNGWFLVSAKSHGLLVRRT